VADCTTKQRASTLPTSTAISAVSLIGSSTKQILRFELFKIKSMVQQSWARNDLFADCHHSSPDRSEDPYTEEWRAFRHVPRQKQKAGADPASVRYVEEASDDISGPNGSFRLCGSGHKFHVRHPTSADIYRCVLSTVSLDELSSRACPAYPPWQKSESIQQECS
jgi:hypothetical protein